MEPMTDELKETIIREHPDGIWLVLAGYGSRPALRQASGKGHSVCTAHEQVKPRVSTSVLMDRIAGATLAETSSGVPRSFCFIRMPLIRLDAPKNSPVAY
jgi:hypothetical protein